MDLLGGAWKIYLPERFSRPIKFQESILCKARSQTHGHRPWFDGHYKRWKEFPVEISLSFTRYKNNCWWWPSSAISRNAKKHKRRCGKSENNWFCMPPSWKRKCRCEPRHWTTWWANWKRKCKSAKKAVEETRKALEKERELNDLKSKFRIDCFARV